MLSDSLNNKEKVLSNLPDKFKIAFDWIEQNFENPPSPGKYPLQNGILAIVDTYKPKPIKTSTYENHHKFIDVQVIVEGREWIFWTKPVDFKQTQEYSEENDIEFFASEDPIMESSKLDLNAGMFTILWPDDWHMPCIAPFIFPEDSSKAEAILKFVIKIPA